MKFSLKNQFYESNLHKSTMNYCIVQCLLLILRTFKFLIASYDILQKKREKKKSK